MTSTVERPRSTDRHGLLVRPARPADAKAIAGLIRTAADLAQVSPDETYPLTPETVEHWITKRRSGYVLERRHEILAYAELVDDARESDRVWIGHMMVAPGNRGLGLGRTLVAALQGVAERDRDAHEIAISAFEDNERALRCYRGCGFRDRGTHRVQERRLIEMRYRVPGRRALVPTPAVAATLVLATAVVLAIAGPAEWTPLAAIPLGTLVPLAAWALLPLLPLRRDGGLRRTVRLFSFTVAVGSVAALLIALLDLVSELDFARGLGLVGAAAILAGIGLLVHVELGVRARKND